MVEPCLRSCDGVDRFDRRPALEPYAAPPGSVPYHRYIQAQNNIARLDDPHAPRPIEPEPADHRPDAPRLGDVSPIPDRPSGPTPDEMRPRHVSEYREAMTGRLVDVVF